MSNISAAYFQRLKERCEDDLLVFTKYIFKEHYGKEFHAAAHHIQIRDALRKVESGEYPNLVINVAPRHTKTELVVKMWMAQCFARNPKSQFIHTSYSDDLALDNSAAVREIIESEAFQTLWPIKINQSTSAKKLWRTVDDGGVRAAASGGPITGFGAGNMGYDPESPDPAKALFCGCIIADDPLKPEDAYSKVSRERVNNRFSNTLKSRRNSPKVPMVIIMQRLHENDPSGYVLDGKLGMEFAHLKIKTLLDDGTAIWPMMITAEELQLMKLKDRYTFASQYQQEPTPEEGGIIHLDWFRRYGTIPEGATIVHSWDTASKGAQHNDPSVCTVWAITDAKAYLVDVFAARVEYPALKRGVVSMADKWTPSAILIEDKSSGQALIQDLRNESALPIIAITPVQDKISRAVKCSGSIEAGLIHLPQNAAWLIDFENEIAMFPNGAHDDRVDSLSQFINWWQARQHTPQPSIRRL